MKKILVPVDFSNASLNALEVAGQLASLANASLYLLHANETATSMMVPQYEFPAAILASEAYTKEASDRMQALKTDLMDNPHFGHVHIEGDVREGLLVSVVKEVVQAEGIDLIVMGTLGTSGWDEVLLGSNTERIIRHAACAVLVIPEGVSVLNIKCIVVPSTLKPDQKSVFETLKAWQESFDFEVRVLYLNDPLHVWAAGGVEAEKDRMAAQAGLQKVQLHTHGWTQNEEEVIQRYAEEVKADLIVMGTHQRRGLSHLLFGSITEDMVNHTHVPVLAVPVK